MVKGYALVSALLASTLSYSQTPQSTWSEDAKQHIARAFPVLNTEDAQLAALDVFKSCFEFSQSIENSDYIQDRESANLFLAEEVFKSSKDFLLTSSDRSLYKTALYTSINATTLLDFSLKKDHSLSLNEFKRENKGAPSLDNPHFAEFFYYRCTGFLNVKVNPIVREEVDQKFLKYTNHLRSTIASLPKNLTDDGLRLRFSDYYRDLHQTISPNNILRKGSILKPSSFPFQKNSQVEYTSTATLEFESLGGQAIKKSNSITYRIKLLKIEEKGSYKLITTGLWLSPYKTEPNKSYENQVFADGQSDQLGTSLMYMGFNICDELSDSHETKLLAAVAENINFYDFCYGSQRGLGETWTIGQSNTGHAIVQYRGIATINNEELRHIQVRGPSNLFTSKYSVFDVYLNAEEPVIERISSKQSGKMIYDGKKGEGSIHYLIVRQK